ncbi:MAG: sigma-54 dependent transcriptional regulator [Kofleriaceae bacterium]
MARLLLTWIGMKDFEGSSETARAQGPVAEAVAASTYDEVHILSDHPAAKTAAYVEWLTGKTKASIATHLVKLTKPTHHREIYEHVIKTCEEVTKGRRDRCDLTFHLSPGTNAMHAVWLLVASTKYPAKLIESSREAGVQSVVSPFEIAAELTDARLTTIAAGTPPDLAKFADIVHKSTEMKRVLEQAARVAPRSVPVLVEGESGTGKELLARAIHAESGRTGKFIAINCGAIPPDLIESELFGHKKGAFTSAVSDRSGVFEAAHEGTLFLDELGELPLDAQVKLLRALQEGEITRVGDTKTVKVDVRIVAATHRTMLVEVSERRFREDLFYRLAVAVLKLPPLRVRRGDILVLVDHILARINAEGAQQGYEQKKLSPATRTLLSKHTWPGNVRELENTLMRAVIWSQTDTISVEEMRNALLASPGQRPDDILHRPLGDGLNLPELLDHVAYHYLKRAMDESKGNKTEAAELVGLPSYQTLTNWLNKYKVPT